MSKTKVTFACSVALLASMLISSSHTGSAAKAQTNIQPSNTWDTSSDSSAGLGQSVSLSGYSFRVPAGYSEIPALAIFKSGVPAGMHILAYHTAYRPDRTSTVLLFGVETPPKGSAEANMKLSDEINLVAGSISSTWKNYAHGSVQMEKVNRYAFGRTYYTGYVTDANTPQPEGACGVTYGARDGRTMIWFDFEDAYSHYQESFPTGEAAVLSFHKAGR